MKNLFPMLAAALVLGLGFSARAATVTAVISADETSVGQPVVVQVRVDGTTNAALPSDLGVAGLESRLTGRSTQVSIINGRMTTSGIYSYTVVPTREGAFEIPPIEVTAEGRKLRTDPLKLTVTPGSPAARPVPAAPPMAGSSAAPSSAGPPEGGDQLAWGELVVPRERIYAGEIVPVEVRYFFNGGVPFRLLRGEPVVTGEGFTFQKFAPPKQAEETINGVRYNTLTFRTAITAVKSGEMPLPKVALEAVAQVPAQAPRGMDDIFSRFFGGQGMPGFVDEREVKVETTPRSIRVQALPAKGRPEGFSGAVGEFTVAATAAPTKAAPGDPVTLTVAVSGRGNFDAMGEPRLVNPEGWRTYPPTDRFEKTDDIGFTGTKTFELPLVAREPRTETPVAEFSYFDPVQEKYVTLRTQPVPVQADAPAASPAPAVASASAAATPAPSPAADEGGQWLEKTTPRSWVPLARRPVFWFVNAAVAGVFAAFLAAGWFRRRREGPAAARAALQRERDRAAGSLKTARLGDAEFLDRALEALAAQARLAGSPGAVEFVRGLEADGRDVAGLRSLLLRADERKFSGGTGVPLDASERQRWADAVREVCR